MSKLAMIYWTVLGLAVLLTPHADASTPGRIEVRATKFALDGSPIHMNGVNTPWHIWDEFGGIDWRDYDPTWWNNEFARIKAKGINSVRVWISCSGTGQPFIDANGYVTGVRDQFWTDVDHLMSLGVRHRVYIMATMLSFDCVSDRNRPPGDEIYFPRWRAMFSAVDKTQAYIDKYLLPFVLRYRDNPYLYAIDLCNEPEWMCFNAECGNIPFNQIQRWTAQCAAAIHRSGSEVLVTVGSACTKWNSDIYEGNYFRDDRLRAQFPDTQAFLDFYQLHYYLWMEPWYPLRMSRAGLGLADRPVVMGELPARDGADVLPAGVTLAWLFEFLLAQDYSGHYPWMSNGGSDLGNLDYFGNTALAFAKSHPDVVRDGSAANQAPVIESAAWADSPLVTLPAGTTVHVVASDPDGDSLTYGWTMMAGPTMPTFATSAAADSKVTFHAAGSYVLLVTVGDGKGGAASSEVRIAVNPLPGDLNGDGVVNVFDLQLVIAHFGKFTVDPGCDVRADANGDGVVNALDLYIVIAHFGMSAA